MTGGGEDAPPPPAASGGEFLLSLLQNPQTTHHLHHHHQQQQQQQQQSPLLARAAPVSTPPPQQQLALQQQQLALDPAVAAVGPTLSIPQLWPSNGRDIPPPWPYALSPLPPNILGFPQSPCPPPGSQFLGNQGVLSDDRRWLGFSGVDVNFAAVQNLVHQKQQDQKLVFGSLPSDIQINESLLNGNLPENSKFNALKEREVAEGSKSHNGFERHRQVDTRVSSSSNSSPYAFQHRVSDEKRGGGWGKQHVGNHRLSPESLRPPPGFTGKPRGGGSWNSGNRRSLNNNVDKQKSKHSQLNSGSVYSNNEDGKIHGDPEVRLSGQLDQPGPPAGSNLHSVSGSEIEESLLQLHSYVTKDRLSRQQKFRADDGGEVDDVGEQLLGSLLLEDESDDKIGKKQHRNSREKEPRIDNRGEHLLSQRMRNLKRLAGCRSDISRLNAPFLSIYESLIPPEEEKAKQKQLVALLEKLVCKEWPDARLYLYGSCANSFGVSKSDIDVCLAIDDAEINKSEVLLKLADVLQSDNLQNVQALTRARVPIVKLMDPVTGISCDICINNVLAVVNTKLLRDYGQIDARLRQLAFIVKHWAKSRGVNETYQGTLSSYAYVLMCIHFLQQRRPAILPCLQGMETTYSVKVDNVECAFFDQVEKLSNFGSHNKEAIAQLVWAFFNYWAYVHDYANSVISIRTGSILSKREKDWTRRVGNDRHLICIEDPFDTSHDLGRVVDKFSIKVLREEFERAAEIMQYDPNPCVTLFEPYVPPQ